METVFWQGQFLPLLIKDLVIMILPVTIFSFIFNSYYLSQYSQTVIGLRFYLPCIKISTISNSLLIFAICFSHHFDDCLIYHKTYVLIQRDTLPPPLPQQYHLQDFLVSQFGSKPFPYKQNTQNKSSSSKVNTDL